MKKFIIALLFIVAAIFPILFIPLLALTLVIWFVIAPSIMQHGGLWEDDQKPVDHTHAGV